MVFYTKNSMRVLLFMQRVTFICNMLFILCLVIIFSNNFINNQAAENYVIILGFVASFFLGIAVNLWEIILLFNKRVSVVPVWLRTVNLVMLLVQIIYHFF